MKTASKFTTLILAGVLLVPGWAWAQQGSSEDHSTPRPTASATPRVADNHTTDGPRTPAPVPKVETAALCTKIGDVTGPVTTETGNRFKQVDDNFAARAGKIDTVFNKVTDNLAANRAKWDAKRQEDFQKLEGKAA